MPAALPSSPTRPPHTCLLLSPLQGGIWDPLLQQPAPSEQRQRECLSPQDSRAVATVACPPHCMRSPNFLGIPLCHGGSVSYSPSARSRAAISSVRSRILPWATDAQENGTPSEEQVAIVRTGRPREDRVTPGKQDTLPRKDRMPPGRQDAFWGSPRTTGAPLAELSLGHRGRCWAVGGVREKVSLRVLLPPSIVPS